MALRFVDRSAWHLTHRDGRKQFLAWDTFGMAGLAAETPGQKNNATIRPIHLWSLLPHSFHLDCVYSTPSKHCAHARPETTRVIHVRGDGRTAESPGEAGTADQRSRGDARRHGGPHGVRQVPVHWQVQTRLGV